MKTFKLDTMVVDDENSSIYQLVNIKTSEINKTIAVPLPDISGFLSCLDCLGFINVTLIQ